MEDNNNSKQILLSIIGIAILVVAVVGVSFAFFTYTRKGKTNNIITTGSITFEIKDPDPDNPDPDNNNPTIKGDNSEPKSDEEGSKDPDPAEIEVEGSLPEGADPVTYYIYAIAGDKPSGTPQDVEGRTWKRFKSNQIKIYFTGTGDTLSSSSGGAGSITIYDNYDYYKDDKGTITAGNFAGELYKTPDDSGKDVSAYTDSATDGYEKDGVHEETGALENGFTLAKGQLPAGQTIDHKFKFRMWINGGVDGKSGVTISDTDYSKDFRASDVGTGDSPLKEGDKDADEGTTLPSTKEKDDRLVYSDMYFSVKLKLVASDDPKFDID